MIPPNIDILSPEADEMLSIFPEELILLDNYNETHGPLDFLTTGETVHIDQMIICFVMQGWLRATINGEEITVAGGEVFTAQPESKGCFKQSSDDCRFIMFIIYPKLLKQVFEDIYINYDRTIYEKSSIHESCSEEQMSVYQLLYTELKKEYLRPEYEHKSLVIRGYLNALLVNNIKLLDVSGSGKEKEGKAESRQYEMFQKFLKALNAYAKHERSVQFYADLLHISPKYLSYVSIQYTGKNASQWIGEYVVHHAKILISIHHKTSKEIADELNFPSLISYNRFFKRIAGVSPKIYKKSINTNTSIGTDDK